MTPREQAEAMVAEIEIQYRAMGLPAHCWDPTLRLWLLEGRWLGGDFMTALIEDRFTRFFSRADDGNRTMAFMWASFLYNHMPSMPAPSYGPERNEWAKIGGLIGVHLRIESDGQRHELR